MKNYTSRPNSRNPQAQRAWDYLQAYHPQHPILGMFYSRDHVDGPRWVSDHGFDGAFSHWCGDTNSPVIGGGGVYAEVTADELRRLTTVSSRDIGS